jgi:putative ABC transport system permease protein
MFKNYLKIAFRNLLGHKGYTFINVAGLAVGMACCILILLYVRYELSYDRYHDQADRIYRVSLHGRLAGNDVNVTYTCVPLAPTLVNEYPEVLHATRLRRAYRTILVSIGDRRFNEERVFYADSTYFSVFTLPLILGDPKTALSAPNSVVLTRETANKYFGEENPIGKTLTFDNSTDYLVTAVSENVPPNSHFHFDFLASFVSLDYHTSTVWISNNLQTYVVLKENASASQLIAKLPGLVSKYVAPQIQQAMGISFDAFIEGGGKYGYSLQPVTDIHLYSKLDDEIEPGSSAAFVTIFSLIALFILILACINFMNLATARSANRAKEVGLRKVVGSNQFQLVRQFLIESILLSATALVLAVILVELFLPAFNNLAAKQIETNYFGKGSLLPGLVIITLLVGLLAGSYPAFFLASFQPISVLKGKSMAGSSVLRSGLVVFQFVISISLIIATFVVYSQLQYIRNKELGFDKEQVVVIQRAAALGDQLYAFQSEVKQFPGILSTTATMHLPGRPVDTNAYKPEGTSESEGYLVMAFAVGYDFVETLGIELAAGRSFSRDFSTDSTALIINEAAVEKFGWADAVGKTIIEPDPEGPGVAQVIGVMKDFHFESLHDEIRPALLRLGTVPRFIAVRISGGDIPGTLAHLGERWSELAPNQPFEYTFLDEDFDRLYRTDQRVGKIFGTFSVLGILVACLGLFGLASFSAEQRTKEIGIRKTLGASISNIILLLSKEFTTLVVISFLIASPLAYFAMSKWLQNFAYRTDIGILTFIAAGGLALLVAWFTVSYQSIKAALANPVEALKYE